jgi:hypothetical protein
LFLADSFFGPLEWDGVFIPAGGKDFDGIDQHFDAGKAGLLPMRLRSGKDRSCSGTTP